jgi:hypothetical protein
MKTAPDSAEAGQSEEAPASGAMCGSQRNLPRHLRDYQGPPNLAALAVGQDMPQSFSVAANRLWLIDVAGFLYAVSMHKFALRDPLSANTGIQGIIEMLAIGGAFVCVVAATWKARRQRSTSITALCFGIFGLFALCSSWRSFNRPSAL